MGNSPAHDADIERPEPADSSTKDELSELRGLLLGPEQRQLESLQEQIEKTQATAERVGRVLPDAIRQCSAQDRELSEALMPTVEEIVDLSVKKNPKTFADALFPVIGPAIRKSIAESFRGMIQALNQALEQSVSWQGLKWRIEALRSGRSFAEVVILHSLVFRVEQVFLIHKQTGLLLEHVAAAEMAQKGPDMISGMLTAIQDFVRDSFTTDQSEGLETIQVGELTVWIEQGPHAILAGVIRGNAPQELRIVFQDALEMIHLEQADMLEAFDGDTSPFESVRNHLEECLLARYKEKKKTVSPLLWFFVGFLIVCLAAWVYLAVKKHNRWTETLEMLRNEPGIVVTSAEKRFGKYFLSGLRDPLAPDPDVLLQKKRIDPGKVESRWDPYQALDPTITLKRAKRILAPPETVSLTLEKGILVVTGMAPEAWLREAGTLARAVPGVMGIKEREVPRPVVEKKEVPLDTVDGLKRGIERQVLFFQFESNELSPGQEVKISDLVNGIQEMSELAKSVDATLTVTVVGHTDPSGPEIINQVLRKSRAEHVRSLLVSRGVPHPILNVSADKTDLPSPQGEASEGKRLQRKVTFQVQWTKGASRKAGPP